MKTTNAQALEVIYTKLTAPISQPRTFVHLITSFMHTASMHQIAVSLMLHADSHGSFSNLADLNMRFIDDPVLSNSIYKLQMWLIQMPHNDKQRLKPYKELQGIGGLQRL